MTTMKMNVNPENRIISAVVHHIQHYNPDRYWRWREIVMKEKEDNGCNQM